MLSLGWRHSHYIRCLWRVTELVPILCNIMHDRVKNRNSVLQILHAAVLLTPFLWFSSSGIHAAAQQQAEDLIYQQLARTVIRLERTPDFPVGTGFFVEYDRTLYLVSSRHIVEVGGDLHARIPARRQGSKDTQVIQLFIPKQAWVLHPSQQRVLSEEENAVGQKKLVIAVDVAVARVPWPAEYQIAPLRYCPSPCSQGRNELAAVDPVPPEKVLAFGFPLYIGVELAEQRPLARVGIVAMTADEPYVRYSGTNSYADARVRLIDIRSFSGNSGSPVFRESGFGDELTLLGIISAGYDELDVAIAEPVSRVRETLELAHTTDVLVQPEWVIQSDEDRLSVEQETVQTESLPSSSRVYLHSILLRNIILRISEYIRKVLNWLGLEN